MSAIRLFIGRMRTELLPALMLALLVGVTAFLAAAGPRLFSAAADRGLRHEVAAASSVDRNIQLGRITRTEFLPSLDAGMEEARHVGERLEAEMPDSVRRVLTGASQFAESVDWRVPDSPIERPAFVALRFQPDLDERVRMIEGRMPAGTTREVAPPEEPPGQPGFQATAFEVALSSITAEELAVGVGDLVHLVPDPDDPLVGAFGNPEPAAIEVVGIYEVLDPQDEFWFDDPALHQPTLIPVGLDITLVRATALASPDAFPALLRYVFPVRYTWRHYVDPERLDAGTLDQLTQDLRRMEGTYASFASAPSDATTLQSGLLGVTERFLAERRSAEAVLMTASIGPIAIALATVAVLAILAMARRRRALILLRGRGGSVPQIVGSHLLEGLLLCVPPAALGALAAATLIEGRPSPWSWVAAAGVALGAMAILVGATLPAALSPLRRLEREDAAQNGSSPRRLVFEGLVVVMAIGGVVLLRQRGLAGGSAAGELGGVDPFLAAVPALIGIAAGIVTLRLYPFPLRVAGWLVAGGRGLVPSLGLRRAERQSGTGHLPLVVLLLTVAIGAFSGTMLATIERGQAAATWDQIGAAHRVTVTTPLPEDLDLSGVPGVDAVAAAHEVDAGIGLAGGTRVELVAIDADDYEAVTAGTPAETRFPGAFSEPLPDERPGTTDLPIPAVVSRSLAREASVPLSVGSTFGLTIESRFATFVVSEVRNDLPGVGVGRPFVIVPRDQLRASLLDRPLVATSIFIRAPESAREDITAALEEAPVDWRLESQAEVHAVLGERPLVQAVELGFAIGLAVALAYAALAVTLSLVLAGSGRARQTAHLRTLGLDRPQVVLLAILEHAPPVLVASVAGLALGVAVGWVVLPGLGLGAFTGAASDPALTVDPRGLVWLAAGLAAIVAVGIGLAAWSQRRTEPARAVREGVQ
jgi:putative ABC transport system permease protein